MAEEAGGFFSGQHIEKAIVHATWSPADHEKEDGDLEGVVEGAVIIGVGYGTTVPLLPCLRTESLHEIFLNQVGWG